MSKQNNQNSTVEKISVVAKNLSGKINNGFEGFKKETKERPLWTNETINRVIIALIIVIIVFVFLKLIGCIFNNGSSLFGRNAWAINQTESYISGFSYGVKEQDLKCKVKSHKRSVFLMECKLKSNELQTQWQTDKLFVSVIEYKNGEAGFCAPASNKREAKECLER